ncbi:DUF3289 family protein [Pantoea sp. Fr+CA_20]|uniref:DUF3289 family protein n=1 Tax=Pantoea TaxID=53335 RepID=UPI002117C505|nr:DUF3289 family protein [Pantoea sp. Fr+CA_20]
MEPIIVYSTQKKFNDSNSDDMKFGDLTDSFLQNRLNLRDVSTVVNPYTLELLTPFNHPQSRFYSPTPGKKISKQTCAKLMFEDLKKLTLPFSFFGPYKGIIKQMFDHMQMSNGNSFKNASLNAALNHNIISDKSLNSSLKRIKEILDKNINYDKKTLPNEAIPQIAINIKSSILPKFTRTQDSFNGLGLAVHDTYSTEISIVELAISQNEYTAKIKYKVQDHFGLDQDDVRNWKFNQFYFFKTWFVLQRSVNFGFRPFFTDMETYVTIKGNSNG